MSPLKLVISFLPLVAYSLVVPLGGVPVAALISLVLAAGVVGVSLVRGESVKVLALLSGAVFAAFLVLALAVPTTTAFLASYGRALAPLAVAAATFALLPVLPFTEQYARENVPQQYWHTPTFRALNRRLSALWGAVIAALGTGHALQEALFSSRPGLGAVVGWVVPCMVLALALHETRKATRNAHHGAHERVGASS